MSSPLPVQTSMRLERMRARRTRTRGRLRVELSAETGLNRKGSWYFVGLGLRDGPIRRHRSCVSELAWGVRTGLGLKRIRSRSYHGSTLNSPVSPSFSSGILRTGPSMRTRDRQRSVKSPCALRFTPDGQPPKMRQPDSANDQPYRSDTVSVVAHRAYTSFNGRRGRSSVVDRRSSQRRFPIRPGSSRSLRAGAR